jgi:hypothetical protein
MFKINSPQLCRRLYALGLFTLTCFVMPACSGHKEEDVPVLPVSGKVMVGKNVLVMGFVHFHPDESKGNKWTKTATGTIHIDGTYKLVTGTGNGLKDGAPPGWYKVVIKPGTPVTEEQASLKPEIFNPDYSILKRTKLAVEVKEGADPKTYDFVLSK